MVSIEKLHHSYLKNRKQGGGINDTQIYLEDMILAVSQGPILTPISYN